MNANQVILKRFEELDALAKKIEASIKVEHTFEPIVSHPNFRPPKTHRNVTTYIIDRESLIKWEASVLSLLSKIYKPTDPVFVRFSGWSNSNDSSSHNKSQCLYPVFQSAKEEFEGGYLFEVRSLVQAEVFSDELDLASRYLTNDGKVASAVIAGVVLEVTLREICATRNLVTGQIAKMNELLRADKTYSQNVWRQIQAWGDIHNAAAHGRPDEFNDAAVKLMIDGIRDFVAKFVA